MIARFDLRTAMYALDPIDEIQSHILGVIAGLMNSYSLNPAQVQGRYEYILSLPQNEVTNSYVEPLQETTPDVVKNLSPISVGKSWADYDDDDEDSNFPEVNATPEVESRLTTNQEADEAIINNFPIHVTTRKQFCSTMQKGFKICPRYSTCTDEFCKNFHVKEEYICKHVTRGSYCDAEGCELIVIRSCRKGKRCNDSECSFRHR